MFAWLGVAAAATAKPVPLINLDWPATAQPRTTATIKRTTLPVRVALGFDSALLLNLGPAQAAKLKAFPIIGKQTVRNPLIPGGEAVARGNMYKVGLASAAAKNVPTVWIDKPIAADADGIVSVLAFDAERVVLQRSGTGTSTGNVTTLVRKGGGEAAVEADVAGTELSIGLDLVSPETVMSATAADALARAGLVKRSGSIGAWTPFPNVRLPFERLTPAPGARLLGLPLARPAARVTEARAKQLDAAAKVGTSTANDDADAITVTATKRRRGTAWVLIGRDVLDRCSRIELDRPGKRWLLTCDF